MRYPPPNYQTRPSGRSIGLALGGLLLIGCCAWSGLLGWFFAPFSFWAANRIDHVQGKVEVIAPAQSHPGGILAPGGRYLILGQTRNGVRERFVWDLATDARYPFTLRAPALCWLNPTQFVVRSSNETYYLVEAQGVVAVTTESIVVQDRYPLPEGLVALRQRWQTADHIYVIDSFGNPAYTVLTIEAGRPYVYRSFGSARDNSTTVEALTQDLPHTLIPNRCNNPPEGVPVYSPDGRYYVKLSQRANAHVLIYTRDGELVARAGKEGWAPRLKGWAYDSSGVYFNMLISGGAASMLMPSTPLFKLSPYTPAEARWALVWRIGGWVAAAGLIAAGGRWAWQRWRRRAS